MRILPANLYQAVKVAYTAKATDTKAKYLPVLNHCRIYRHDGLLKVEATNLEKAARKHVPALFVKGEEVNICVPLKPFRDWLNVVQKNYNAALIMTFDYQAMTLTAEIEGERSRTVFNCMHAQEWPNNAVDELLRKEWTQ